MDPPSGHGPEGPRRRRPRYRGTHPRRFEERYKERDPVRYPEMEEHIRAQGRTPAGSHVPVLLETVLEALAPAPGETVADCTLGRGGHAAAILTRIAPGGLLLGLDVDGAELERTRALLAPAAGAGALRVLRRNFAGLDRAAAEEGIAGFDAILADLGASSMQLDDPARGFSFREDGPLDMRMDDRRSKTAAGLLAALTEEALARAFRELADEPDAGAVAAEIVRRRAKAPLARSAALLEAVLAAKGVSVRDLRRRGALPHPAARVFQALRILVNEELDNLRRFLAVAPGLLKPGGRLGVISFHSGEDRLVKEAFRDGLRSGLFASASPEPLRAGPEERRANPRSAPAKLRVAAAPGP